MRNRSRCLRSMVAALAGVISTFALGHGQVRTDADEARHIDFPDTGKYVTLVVDLHTHSVFSDGHVWPNVRVAEALRDGLDAVAITEHLEYQPHQVFIPHPDRNVAFDEATQAAFNTDLIVVAGSEITRAAPNGHMNAVFITDANALWPVGGRSGSELPAFLAEWTPQEAVAAANAQRGFVFWNHPWGSPRTPHLRTELTEVQQALIEQGQLHGIEIVNGKAYNEEAHRIAVENDLTYIGTSDVHNLIDWDYDVAGNGHRPVTLVLANERSADGIKEALFAKRTVVWFDNLLIGRDKPLQALLHAGLVVESAIRNEGDALVQVTLRNNTDATLQLRHLSTASQSLHRHADLVEVAPQSQTNLTVKPAVMPDELTLEFEVLNALTTPNTHPAVTLQRAIKVVSLPSSYTYTGEPQFTIAFPLGADVGPPTQPGEVFVGNTPDGVKFTASVADIADGLSLGKVADFIISGGLAGGVGSDFKVTENRPITLADGTPANRAEISWVYAPADLNLKTQVVAAFKNGKVVWVIAHEQERREHISKLVESLRFD